MSWFPQNEYISKPDKGIIATLSKEVGATSCRYSVELTRETIGYQRMMAFQKEILIGLGVSKQNLEWKEVTTLDSLDIGLEYIKIQTQLTSRSGDEKFIYFV